jgi:hypothetical protein
MHPKSFALTLGLVVFGCSSGNLVLVTSDAGPLGGDPDAGTVSDAPPTPPTDASIDAPQDASGCKHLVVDQFSPADPRWVASGSASLLNGEAVLTTGGPKDVGAIWLAIKSKAKTLHIAFKLRVNDAVPSGYQGIALAFTNAPDAGAPTLGVAGSGVGFCGGPVNGSALKVMTGTTRSSLSIEHTSGNNCQENDIKSVAIEASNELTVDLSSTALHAELRNGTGKVDFDAQFPEMYAVEWIGFTGATGEGASRHVIDDVDIYACP